MVGQMVSHYKILEKLGEGGMGVVYKAQDMKLDRIVALKFLPSHLTASEEEKSRFLQEAKAASALNHPNVCTIYGIEEHDGQQFIEMEYVDGAMLESKIQGAGLKIQDALTYAIQIGEALAEAHAKGITHRDIKSSNIMVNSKNQIKVMDFGLAKLKGSLKLTRAASTIGTLAYMPPEQIQGGEADERSDIFSFGVVLYEMLTGRLPFRGEHEAAMMYSIVNEEPEPIERSRPDIPPELVRIIKRSLEKDREDRYQHVDDMVSELRRVKKQSARLTQQYVPTLASLSPDRKVSEAAQPPTSATAPRPSRKGLSISIISAGVVLVGIVGYILFRGGVKETATTFTGRKMLVVLPFENLGSPDQEYFADGITEEITSKLSGLSGLGVIARSSAMQYKKTTKPIKQIGDELGVSYVLQGTIRWESIDGTSRVRVNPQLINVADGTQIWSQPSVAVLSSAFELQSQIAGHVADALNITLLQHEKQSLEAKLTDNAQAYDAYLRGIEYQFRSTDERDYRIAEQMFQRAVDLDPKFAQAYARLGDIHAAIYWEFYDRTEERVRKSKEAAEKALQLNPDLPDAHGAIGWYYYHCLRDYDNAIKEFQIALQSQPNNMNLLIGIASVYRRQGKLKDALSNFKKASDNDPRSAGVQNEVGITSHLMRKYAEAEQSYDRAMNLSPDWGNPYADKATLYMTWLGSTARAREVLEKAKSQKVGEDNPYFIRTSVLVNINDGKYREAIDYLAQIKPKVLSSQEFYAPTDMMLALPYGYLGQSEMERTHYDAARTILERDSKSHPTDSRVMSALGITYAGLGRKSEAVQMGKRALELLPITKDALLGVYRLEDLAVIYTMIGNTNDAINTLEQLLNMPSWMSVQRLRIEAVWNPLRGNPRFQNLLSENK